MPGFEPPAVRTLVRGTGMPARLINLVKQQFCKFLLPIDQDCLTLAAHRRGRPGQLLRPDNMADNVESVLSKIRPHTSSSLAHQKAPATLLRAIEATFRDQATEPSPTAYFAALITTLDGALQSSRASGPALGEGDVLPAVLYLLAAVAPYVPPPVIRSHLSTILSLTSPLFPTLSAHAPPLRSQLTLYGAVLIALERPQLDTQGLRQAFMSIVQLTLDPRPKVRKRAAEVVKDVLSAPPRPLIKHPYAEKVAEWVKAALAEVSAGGLPKFKGKKAESEGSEAAIHLLAFLRPVLPTLPAEVSIKVSWMEILYRFETHLPVPRLSWLRPFVEGMDSPLSCSC